LRKSAARWADHFFFLQSCTAKARHSFVAFCSNFSACAAVSCGFGGGVSSTGSYRTGTGTGSGSGSSNATGGGGSLGSFSRVVQTTMPMNAPTSTTAAIQGTGEDFL
jgi:hypothetical protein